MIYQAMNDIDKKMMHLNAGIFVSNKCSDFCYIVKTSIKYIFDISGYMWMNKENYSY